MTDPVTKESEVKIISNIDKKSITISKFKGIDCRTEKSDSLGSAFVKNFRFKHDGSLEKREGYTQLASLPGIIRTVWTGILEGSQRCFALVEDQIYEITSSGEALHMATANTYTGKAELFCYRGKLYLIDTTGIYSVNKGSLSNPTGYVPLVGKMWKDGEVGEIYQPRNLISNHARYSYIMGGNDYKLLFLDQPIVSVDAVYVNGIPLNTDEYYMASDTVISIYTLKSYDRVTVAVTYPPRTDPTIEAYSCSHATVFGGANNSRPFFWGNENSPATMYSCGYVSDDDLAESKKFFPESDYFYLPQGSDFTVGDGQFPIRAVSRHYDRLLIFTEGGTWMADDPDCAFENRPPININMNVGVSSDGAATPIENQPCCVGNNAIWRWNSHTDELNDCNAYSISDPIASHLPVEFYNDGNVFADASRRELLFTSSATIGKVWVYSIENNAWSCFEGIYANEFFNLFGKIGFFHATVGGSYIYYFTHYAYTDMGEEIVATFESNILDSEYDLPVRLSDISVKYSDGNLGVIIDTDTCTSKLSAYLPSLEKPCKKSFRANTGRAKNFKLRITAGGSERQTLHSVGIKIK